MEQGGMNCLDQKPEVDIERRLGEIEKQLREWWAELQKPVNDRRVMADCSMQMHNYLVDLPAPPLTLGGDE